MAVRGRIKPAMAALCMCVVLPVATVAARSRAGEHKQVDQILDRAQKVCERVAPDLGAARLSATPLTSYRHGKERRLWSVQVSDASGEYVGDTVWDADRGELVGTAWHVEPNGAREKH